MDREDAIEVLSLLKMAYPTFYRDLSKRDAENAIKLWTLMFPEPYKEIEVAIQVYISTSTFPPTVADIRKSLTNARTKQITSDDAWGQVKSAISRFGYYQETLAIESMDPIVATLVKRLGYKDLCMSENQMADRAHFIKLFDNLTKREQQTAMIPEALKAKIALQMNQVKTLEIKKRTGD